MMTSTSNSLDNSILIESNRVEEDYDVEKIAKLFDFITFDQKNIFIHQFIKT
jgi:hypothetical protein